MVRNIILIGLPGSGKTALGTQAAERFGLDFLDTDAEIQRRTGRTIPEIFAGDGEQSFRDLESAAARDIAKRSGTAVATGGGVVLREENMRALRQNGLIIFIDRPPEHIVHDVATSGRPLLADGAERVFALSGQRRPLYLKYADIVLPNDGGEREALERLCMLIRSEYLPDNGFAVIGDPIAHTLSPPIHRAVFNALGLDMPYEAIHVPKGTAGVFAQKARASGLKGFNVTIPHKQDIIPFLDEVDPEAALCGAVNTVVIRDGKLNGYNTDMGGLLGTLRGKGYGYKGRNVAILGAGGAARGIALKAALEQAARITVVGWYPEEAAALRKLIGRAAPEASCDAAVASPETLASAAEGADILINATPLGMEGVKADFPSLDFLSALPSGAPVCDLVYTPQKTALLREAGRLGHPAMNGLGMLIGQAILADELFLGRTLDREGLRELVEAQYDDRQ